jgi:hypothetical protein
VSPQAQFEQVEIDGLEQTVGYDRDLGGVDGTLVRAGRQLVTLRASCGVQLHAKSQQALDDVVVDTLDPLCSDDPVDGN